MFVKKLKGLYHYCGAVTVPIINFSPIESRLGNQNSKKTQIDHNSLDNIEEDEDAIRNREIDEALAQLTSLRIRMKIQKGL